MIHPFRHSTPQIHSSCFVAPTSVVIGDVVMGEGSSLWFQGILRGDVHSIRIGSRTNIQDLSVIHVTNREAPRPASTIIGDDVTIGHRVIVHGCTIEDRCLIGMGSVLLDGVVVETGSIIGAGSVVTPGTRVPPGSMAMGAPARVVRLLTDEEKEHILLSSQNYCRLASEYRTMTL